MSGARSLEERLKFDLGLQVGSQLELFTFRGQERRVLVDIGSRGVVRSLMEPHAGEMHTSWFRITGDRMVSQGGTVVWAARRPKMLEVFAGKPVASVCLEETPREGASA